MDTTQKQTLLKIAGATLFFWVILKVTAYQAEQSEQIAQAPYVSSLVSELKQQDRMVKIYGKVEALGAIHIDSQVNAIVDNLPVKSGDKVKAGDLLLDADKADLLLEEAHRTTPYSS